MPLLGLTGYPLAHSFSPAYFKQRFEAEGLDGWDYRLFPLEDLRGLPELIRHEPELLALNVTIPHKQDVLQYCSSISEEAAAIGAANLILIERESTGFTLRAHNTDHFGFSESLRKAKTSINGRALILGSGGSSKAVAYALKQMQIPFDVAGRSLPLNYGNLDLAAYSLIVNCSPVGMQRSDPAGYPTLLPLNYDAAHAGQLFYDLVYNPAETDMMQRFSARGASVMNGLNMLHLQADKAWEIIKSKHNTPR